MKQYLDQWNIIEGALTVERINEIPDCLEKDHLFLIRKMLKEENFEPNVVLVSNLRQLFVETRIN
ncbi:hypothetical protein SS9_01104 [Enterococcus faecium EnGen0188]|uniref:hypothetical protein n=1 Tax=Enterococcus faecium TaxID=1352 RepID=UPI00032F4FC5|nr:hypothetical protein [Enterococcus faecium]EOM63100.1 hypothetical protein SS9_01104 [Enterococcus faecium EnGen0188]